MEVVSFFTCRLAKLIQAGIFNTDDWRIYADGYAEDELIYVWDGQGVKFISDVELSQFDLISSPYRNASISRKQGLVNV